MAAETWDSEIMTDRVSVAGLLVTCFATVLAINFVPEDPAPTGALFMAAIVMAIGLAGVPIIAAFRYPKSLLLGGHLLAVAPIYWLLLDLLQSAYPLEHLESEQARCAFIGIGLFVGAMWIGHGYRPWKLTGVITRTLAYDVSAGSFFRLAVVAFLLGMLKFAVPANFDIFEMLYYVGQARWDAPWVRGQLGGWDAFLDQLQYFCYLLPTLTIIVARNLGWNHIKTLVCGGMTMVVTVFLAQSGSRRVIGVVFGMALLVWLLTQPRVRAKQVFVAIASSAVLLLSLEIILDYRNIGLSKLFTPGEGIVRQNYVRVDDNFYRLSQTIGLIPQYYPYTYHKYIIWVLIRPIPRVFWPGKPTDPGFDLPAILGAKGVSLTSSVIGELYMAAGFVGIALGGWLYGRIASMASQLLTQSTTFGALMIYAILTMSLFAGVRSMLELVLINYALVAWLILSWVYIHFKEQQYTQ
jgi:oligosaccharide repeat unit polymerase